MIRWFLAAALVTLALVVTAGDAQAQNAFNPYSNSSYNTQDWSRFNHYPYVYYPQNFWNPDYFRSSNSLYHRYPPEMRIPVYNHQWQNYYPEARLYHQGNHFHLDVF